MGESMLEEFMIRPILNKVLGHHFVPQAKVEQNAKRPDYAFFENEIDLNEAFIVDSKKKNDILNNNPKTNIFFKPFLEGKDIDKWAVKNAEKWLILFPKGWSKEVI